jgi:GT2 family glycosyltransferase
VDDASTDTTRVIATDERWRDRVRYIYNDQASGFADAFNRVATLASSGFVVFLSADDLLDPTFLEHVEGGLTAYPHAKFCYVAARYIDAEGRRISPGRPESSRTAQLYDGRTYIFNYLTGCLSGNEVHRCVGTSVDRKLFVEECRFRKEAGILADNDFFIRIAKKTEVVGIAQQLASVRIHADAISSRQDSLNLRVAEDYLYQLRFLKAEPRHVTDQDLFVAYALACRSIGLLLAEAVLRGRRDLGSAALRLQQEASSLMGRAPPIVPAGLLFNVVYRWAWASSLYRGALSAAAMARWMKGSFGFKKARGTR